MSISNRSYAILGTGALGGYYSACLQRAGISIKLAEDLRLARWQKLVWNIPYNGLSGVLDATTDELMPNQYTRSLVEQLMREGVAGAALCDRIIPDCFIQTMPDYREKMTPYRTSMKIDYDEKRPLEVEAIFGNPLRIATTAGTDLSLILMLYRQLKFLDAVFASMVVCRQSFDCVFSLTPDEKLCFSLLSAG